MQHTSMTELEGQVGRLAATTDPGRFVGVAHAVEAVALQLGAVPRQWLDNIAHLLLDMSVRAPASRLALAFMAALSGAGRVVSAWAPMVDDIGIIASVAIQRSELSQLRKTNPGAVAAVDTGNSTLETTTMVRGPSHAANHPTLTVGQHTTGRSLLRQRNRRSRCAKLVRALQSAGWRTALSWMTAERLQPLVGVAPTCTIKINDMLSNDAQPASFRAALLSNLPPALFNAAAGSIVIGLAVVDADGMLSILVMLTARFVHGVLLLGTEQKVPKALHVHVVCVEGVADGDGGGGGNGDGGSGGGGRARGKQVGGRPA